MKRFEKALTGWQEKSLSQQEVAQASTVTGMLVHQKDTALRMFNANAQ